MIDAGTLIRAIEAAEFEPQSYSGRGMYGKRCVGFVTDGDLFSAGAAVAAALVDQDLAHRVEDLAELGVSRDSMGHDTIVYFRGVPWPEGLAEPEAA
jgi:hypothetical protein